MYRRAYHNLQLRATQPRTSPPYGARCRSFRKHSTRIEPDSSHGHQVLLEVGGKGVGNPRSRHADLYARPSPRPLCRHSHDADGVLSPRPASGSPSATITVLTALQWHHGCLSRAAHPSTPFGYHCDTCERCERYRHARGSGARAGSRAQVTRLGCLSSCTPFLGGTQCHYGTCHRSPLGCPDRPHRCLAGGS